jgi:hypothetical protein
MAKRIGRLTFGAFACGCVLAGVAAAQTFEVKAGFQCRIELPASGEDVTTYDSARICAQSYISVTCRKPVDSGENPATTLADIDCEIDTATCDGGPENLVQADLSTLKIDENGLARLNCLVRLNP